MGTASAARQQLLDDVALAQTKDHQVSGPESRTGKLRSLWAVPVIVLSCALIGLGLYLTLLHEPPVPVSKVLSQASKELADGKLEQATALLRGSVEPRLDQATAIERASYFRLVGDLLVAWRLTSDNKDIAYARKICDVYGRARAVGGGLNHLQVESMALAQIECGNILEARNELEFLGAKATHPAHGDLVRPGMYRVLQAIVLAELDLYQDDPARSLAILEAFIFDVSIPKDTSTLAWLMLRQAEIELAQGKAQEVIDQLLVFMRRLEQSPSGVGKETLAEISVVLGEAYELNGDPIRSRHHLNTAMQNSELGSLHRARVLVNLGDLNLSEGKIPEATVFFDEVIFDYPQTKFRADALLGRAAGFSIEGQHQESIQDYQEACTAIEMAPASDEQRLRRIAIALTDRHDAAIVQRDLVLALDYIILANGFFPSENPPVSVLERLASTSKQLADNLTTDQSIASEITKAHKLYRQAGDTHLEIAQAIQSLNNHDHQLATHLRLASESYDQGAWRSATIEVCQTYLASFPVSDARAPEIRQRLATNHEAQLDYESAASIYQEVIDLHPSSPAATASFVPLARCLRTLERSSEAKQHLLAVISGDRGLAPAAIDFRDAMILLGEIEYEEGRWARGIEFLTQAAVRYPLDPRRGEVLFRIGDCYRQLAAEQSGLLRDMTPMSQEKKKSLQEQRKKYLRSSMSTFSQIMSTPVQGLALDKSLSDEDRLARLYFADCAFELGTYDQAITEYESVARRYPKHHSSVYALVQIVNAYTNLESANEAQAAHRRAMIRLGQIPESAFAEPDALMDRRAWERWIESSPVTTTVQVGTDP